MLVLDKVRLTLESAAGPVSILKGVDLELEAGTSLSVVGPSGSGKSSLLAVTGGIERPTSGEVTIAGQKLSLLDEDALAKFRGERIGVIFQSFHLVPTMTALENVALPLEIAGRRDAFERAREGLASVRLDHRPDHFPAQLSGGEQQRVAMARALATEPKLLLADEPTGNLDGSTGEAVIELLFETTKARGVTMMLITHDEGLAKRCDRLARMRDGALAFETPDRAAADAAERVA